MRALEICGAPEAFARLAFARELASLGDLYVNDAFGTAHRAHASTEALAHLLPSAAGLLMQAELAALASLTDDPAHPYVCVIGGAAVFAAENCLALDYFYVRRSYGAGAQAGGAGADLSQG